MTMFAEAISDFWALDVRGDVLYEDAALILLENPELEERDQIVLLWTADDGRTSVAVAPAVAQLLVPVLAEGRALTVERLREAIAGAGIVLHDADNLFYLPRDGREELLAEPDPSDIRRLGASDAELFSAFEAEATPEDLDDALVGLDDWAAFGVVEDGRLVSAGSMYPFQEEHGEDAILADIGVLTLARSRGAGHARRLVRAMIRFAVDAGYEPQYRCQLDNSASVALAESLGLALYGRWQVVTPDEEQEGSTG
ncbi:GNAT superfamily N-acetyltransferase [Microbacterium resistens]|uniref:GNAT superfamily N-acetyltransferase n=1 Tax=Microbacterium resistens TaxID=156977 RepID=A0ABU1SFC8_9MICO|nr:GNAT family N-acetyltransferase [Microbacterium resistens]MDR6868290.1 GNAT superfamily N-acetyltransferase [Microbacterium resistens]